MGDNRLFDDVLQTAAQALDLRSRRHDLIISNIANADTPGYKAFDLMVEEALKRQKHGPAPITLTTTHAQHLSVSDGVSPLDRAHLVQPQSSDYLRGDGNTVDMEREMTQLSANQLLYKLTTQIVANKFKTLKSAIQGGKS